MPRNHAIRSFSAGTYVWKNEWNSKYMSPWAYIQRYAYANALSIKELYEETKNNIYKERTGLWDLVSCAIFDDARVRNLLGVSFITLNSEFFRSLHIPTQVFPMPKKLICTSFRNELTTCPECIKHGFHSFFHQLIAVERCAFHNLKLTNMCPGCGCVHTYRLFDKRMVKPFVCRCGYVFIDEQQPFSDKWKLDDNITISTSEVLALLHPKETNIPCQRPEGEAALESVRKVSRALLEAMRI